MILLTGCSPSDSTCVVLEERAVNVLSVMRWLSLIGDLCNDRETTSRFKVLTLFNLFINNKQKLIKALNKFKAQLRNYSRTSLGLSSVGGFAVSASAEATSLPSSSELSSSLELLRTSVCPSACRWRSLSS